MITNLTCEVKQALESKNTRLSGLSVLFIFIFDNVVKLEFFITCNFNYCTV